jgi:hypothetical protein
MLLLNFGCRIFRAVRHGDQNNRIIVKYSLALVSSFAFVGVMPGVADDLLPPRFNFDRYAAMIDHSPFAVATAVALPAATPDFAKDLYVANAAHSSEGDMVTLMSSSDHNLKKYLSTKEAVDGYSIASIEWSEKVGETKVTISKDGKFATVTFNQALLSQAAPPGPAVPGEVSQNVSLVPAPRVSQVSRPHSRGVIQRNPKAVTQPATSMVPTLPPPNPISAPELAPPVVTPVQPGITSEDGRPGG